MTTLAFDVHGRPGAQGSKKHVGNGVMVESSKKVKPWRSDVKTAAEAALVASDEWETGYRGPVAAQIVFTFARPLSHYGTGRSLRVLKPTAPRYVMSRGAGDVDKLERSTFDALTASGAIHDDSQIVHVEATKMYGSVSGAHIVLHTVTPDPVQP